MTIKGLKKKTGGKTKVKTLKFSVDTAKAAEDNIIEAKALEQFLKDRIKVNGKPGNLGDKVQVDREKSKINVTAQAPFAKNYLKYLSKKYLKSQGLRDYLRVVATSKTGYELRYYKTAEDQEED
mmetsp:Transcript_38703/g.82184  ORF Transcript_38703/g.82184 Transcript_38703/m.82184 type:complete len:124 (-) Transcript_38703:111-482(-)